ncbi:MAG: hypothetical protein IKW50_06725 [Oscillospiraceae bacterium]|nr:hypothetical protein [Oscillospiraceae bacterium]
MKRSICIILAILLCVAAVFPMTVSAETYKLSGTDMSITVDDSSWYVFTRDNIENNPQLEELGITYERIYSILHDNNAYMDAALFVDGGVTEILVVKTAGASNIVNMSDYSDAKILEEAASLAKEKGIENYSVYEGQFKFIRFESYEPSVGVYLCEYLTIINKDIYCIKVQSGVPFEEWQYDEMTGIIDSISFDIDETLVKEAKIASGSRVLTNVLIAGATGAVSVTLKVLFGKKKNQEEDSQN